MLAKRSERKAERDQRAKVVRLKSPATRVARKEKTHHKGVFSFLVAGVGFEPHDLRVMSPTSYRAAPSRDMLVPEAGVEPVRDVNLTGF